MSNTNQAADPSMEEILASIRRIISDDDTPEAAPEAASEPVAVPDPEPEEEMDDANSDIDAMLADMEADSHESDNVTAMPDFDSVPDADDDDDIFDLTDIVEDEETKSSANVSKMADKPLVGVEDQDLCFDDAPAVRTESEPAPVSASPPAQPQPKESLLSPGAAADASAAFGVLANTILTSSGNSRTLEDLVQDLLRPMLKSWLDENLPPLVERLVREEIERVARQGR